MKQIWEDFKMQYRMGGILERLIFWNIVLFVVPFVLQAILSLFLIPFDFLKFISVSSNPEDLLWKPWSVFTYAFFHSGFFHILFNLIILNFAGRIFLTFFSQKQLFGLYLMGALFGALLFILGFYIFPRFSNVSIPMIGASAAVNAILFAAVAYNPMYSVRLLLIGTVKLWHIAAVFFLLDIIRLAGSNAGGHLAHIGGAVFGVFFINQLRGGKDITRWIMGFWEYIVGLFSSKPKSNFKKVHRNSSRSTANSKVQPPKVDEHQKKIDAILDKISASGYDSLTKEEKEYLFKAGNS